MAEGMRLLLRVRELFFTVKLDTLFRRLGHRPRFVPAGESIAAWARAEPPDAVFLDLTVPDPDLPGTIAALREVARSSGLRFPIVAFGPHKAREAWAEARAAGCDRVVANSELVLSLPALLETLRADESQADARGLNGSRSPRRPVRAADGTGSDRRSEEGGSP